MRRQHWALLLRFATSFLPATWFRWGSRLLAVLKEFAWLSDLIQLVASILFAMFGEMEVDEGGLQAAVSQELLDPSQRDAGFEQVSRHAMSEGVDRNAFGELQFGDDSFHAALHGGGVHGHI